MLRTYKKLLKDNENEEMNKYNISTNAELTITLLEAINLQHTSITLTMNPYIVLKVENKVKFSSVKENTTNPVWNEDFLFSIESPESVVYIEIIDQYTKNSIGTSQLNLSDFLDQQKTEKVIYLKPSSEIKVNNSTDLNKSTPFTDLGIDPSNMILSIRIRFFWSKFNYFTLQIKSIEDQMKENDNDLDLVNKLLSKVKSPFGLIIYGYFDQIKENDLLELPKAKEDILEKQRLTVLPKGYQSNPQLLKNIKCFSYANNIDRMVSKVFSTDIEWNKTSNYILVLIVALSLIQMLERPDFPGLIITLLIFYYNSNWGNVPFYEIINKIKIIIVLLTVNFIFDFIWVILNMSEYWNFNLPCSFYKKLCFSLALINLLMKIFITISMWISFSKNRFKRNEKLFDDNRRTHIEFYRSTIKGRFSNRDTNIKKSIFRLGGNISIVNSQSFSNNVNQSNIKPDKSYDQGLFKKN